MPVRGSPAPISLHAIVSSIALAALDGILRRRPLVRTVEGSHAKNGNRRAWHRCRLGCVNSSRWRRARDPDPETSPSTRASTPPQPQRAPRAAPARTRAERACPRARGSARGSPGWRVADSRDGARPSSEVLERLGLAGDEFAERHLRPLRRRAPPPEPRATSSSRSNLQGRTAQIEQELLDQAVAAIDQLGRRSAARSAPCSASSLYSLGCPTPRPPARRALRDGPGDRQVPRHRRRLRERRAADAARRAGAARSTPREHVLVVAAESMSWHPDARRATDDPRAKTVGSAIFGDGCAAALLSRHDRDARGPGDPRLAGPPDRRARSTPSACSSTTSDSYLHLARELPDLAGARARASSSTTSSRANRLQRATIDHWMRPPGRPAHHRERAGRARALRRGRRDQLGGARRARQRRHALDLLRAARTRSSATSPAPGEHGLMVTIGPGVTVGLMLLRLVSAASAALHYRSARHDAHRRDPPRQALRRAKQRLGASVADALRARARAGDGRRRAAGARARPRAIERTIVVTREPRSRAAAREHGRDRRRGRGRGGPVGGRRARRARARWPRASSACCACPATAPRSTRRELDALLARARPRRGREVVIVPDRHGTGTNGLLLAPPDAIAPSFGPDSCERHRALARAAGVRLPRRAPAVAAARHRHRRRPRRAARAPLGADARGRRARARCSAQPERTGRPSPSHDAG